MEKNIAVIWGDCSSPEIVKQTLRVLDKVAEKYGHTFHYTLRAFHDGQADVDAVAVEDTGKAFGNNHRNAGSLDALPQDI